jgi:hypothetical protein
MARRIECRGGENTHAFMFDEYGRTTDQGPLDVRGAHAKILCVWDTDGAIIDSRTILSLPKLAGIMNIRDKHLAHSLSQTRRQWKAGPVAPMKYCDEREMLLVSLPIVEALFCWVNGKSFSFEDGRKIDRKNATALWTGCTFNIA